MGKPLASRHQKVHFCNLRYMKLLLFSKKNKNPHTGNTQPSCTCVVQEYQYYTISKKALNDEILKFNSFNIAF